MLPIVLTLGLTVAAGVLLTAGACHLFLGVMPSHDLKPVQVELQSL
ncbi:MAG: hypothetical protein ACI9U2_001023 [Bradymonadia bacterium]|jgi:hypothetical protein